MSSEGRRHTLFYAGLIYAEYELWPASIDVPDGAYMFSRAGSWFIFQHGSFSGINLCDVPPELRTLCLLMGI